VDADGDRLKILADEVEGLIGDRTNDAGEVAAGGRRRSPPSLAAAMGSKKRI